MTAKTQAINFNIIFTVSKREVTSCVTLTRMRSEKTSQWQITSLGARNAIHFKQFQLDREAKTFCRGLPPAILSISLRSNGSLWIFCITSLAVTERLKLQKSVRLHHQSTIEEVNDSLQDVLLHQWPVQTWWQHTRPAVGTCRLLYEQRHFYLLGGGELVP